MGFSDADPTHYFEQTTPGRSWIISQKKAVSLNRQMVVPYSFVIVSSRFSSTRATTVSGSSASGRVGFSR